MFIKIFKTAVLAVVIFLFPLFFLPFTQEYFVTGKLYLLGGAALLLILLSTVELAVTKKIQWQKTAFDNLLALLAVTLGLSVVLVTPNKVQSLLNPNFGIVTIVSLTVIYFYLVREKRRALLGKLLNGSAIFTSLITVIFFLQPFKNAALPAAFQFLKNPAFTPLGSQLDLAIFLGFFAVFALAQLYVDSKARRPTSPLMIITFILSFAAAALSAYGLTKTNALLLPPVGISWYAAVETLKNPLTALFGVGVDNFAAIFTRVKDAAYNQSALWQIATFNLSRSAILHVFTETGLAGIAALSLLFIALFKQNKNHLPLLLATYFLLVAMLLFPVSLPVWFLFFLLLAFSAAARPENQPQSAFDLSALMPVYLGMIIIGLAVVGVAGWGLFRSYQAEAYFNQALGGIAQNNVKTLYDYQRLAIIADPYIERYHLNFAQTNLLIANNIASKTTPAAKGAGAQETKPAQLSDADKQTIAQAIQAAIAEAKAAVTLNPQKSTNWENLAAIYRNVLNVAQGADSWTISSYQRAIVADPQNPTYRLNLGGVYYTLQNYNEAYNMFQQAVAVKPDWPNAHYNLAWAAYQKGDYPTAAASMQNVLSLLDPKTNKADYERAQKDLDEFKKKLPQTEAAASGAAAQTQTPNQLTLPTPPEKLIEPKITLPKEASPEAK